MSTLTLNSNVTVDPPASLPVGYLSLPAGVRIPSSIAALAHLVLEHPDDVNAARALAEWLLEALEAGR